MAKGIVRVEVNKQDLARLQAINAVIPAMIVAVRKVMRDEAKVQKNLLNMPTSNWSSKNKPHWRTVDSSSTRKVAIDLKTTSTPYVFLEGGTKVRYRIMSRDWVSKTKPKSLLAGPGRGRPKGFGIAKGITKREWREKVFQMRETIFRKKLNDAIARSMKPAFPSGTGRIIF